MKNENYKLILLFAFFLFACQEKNIDVAKVKSQHWKNNGGAWFSDTINFLDEKGEGFYLDSDFKVYLNGKLIGTVIKGDSKEMIILTIKNEESHFISY